MRQTNIYVGVHGAGLMHASFLAEEAVLIEVHPSYRLDRHFRLAAKQSGKVQLITRISQSLITCSELFPYNMFSPLTTYFCSFLADIHANPSDDTNHMSRIK